MKLAIDRDRCVEVLKAVSGAVPARSTKPILSSVRLEARDGVLRARGTDLEFEIEAECEADVSEPGAVMVPQRLAAILQSDRGERVLIETTDSGIVARTDSGRFKVATESPDDFPASPKVVPQWTATMPTAAFAAAVKRVEKHPEPATRYAMGSVAIDGDGGVTMVATDGRVVASQATGAGQDGAVPGGIILADPGRISKAARIVAGLPGSVTLLADDAWLVIRAVGCTFRIRRNEGRWPEWRKCFPKDLPAQIEVDAGRIVAAARQVATIYTGADRIGVVLKLEGGRLSISTGDSPDGDGVVQMPLAYPSQYEGTRACVSWSILCDVLSVLDGTATLGFFKMGATGALTVTTDDGYRVVIAGIAEAGE